MRITSDDNADFRPGLPDSPNDPSQDHNNFIAGRTLSCPEDCGDQLAAFAFIDMKRHVTIAVMVGIEECKLLMAMSRIRGVIQIQDDAFGRFFI